MKSRGACGFNWLGIKTNGDLISTYNNHSISVKCEKLLTG
jgi:hypothetical protein